MRDKNGRFIRKDIAVTTVRLNDAIISAPPEPAVVIEAASPINALDTREQWLNRALSLCRAHLSSSASADVPMSTRVSCGFPGGGSARKRIGECWPDSASADASTEIFISPVLADAPTVLSTLLHEAIHAAVGCKVGHKGPFKRVALLAGLEGKMTSTNASPKLLETVFPSWIAELGTYPHAVLSMMGRKKQSTRLVKCSCPECGYVVRTTAKWIEQAGAPLCPTCEADEDSDRVDGRIQMQVVGQDSNDSE